LRLPHKGYVRIILPALGQATEICYGIATSVVVWIAELAFVAVVRVKAQLIVKLISFSLVKYSIRLDHRHNGQSNVLLGKEEGYL